MSDQIVTTRVNFLQLGRFIEIATGSLIYGVEWDDEARVLSITTGDRHAPEGATERVGNSYYADDGEYLGERNV